MSIYLIARELLCLVHSLGYFDRAAFLRATTLTLSTLLFFLLAPLKPTDKGFTVCAYNRTTSKVDDFLNNEAKGKYTRLPVSPAILELCGFYKRRLWVTERNVCAPADVTRLRAKESKGLLEGADF